MRLAREGRGDAARDPVMSETHSIELVEARADIDAWVRGLPIEDTAAATERVLHLLAEMEQSALPCRERLAMLEALGRPVSLLFARLRPHFVGAGVPLSHKGKYAVWLINKVCRRLIRGYDAVFAVKRSLVGRYETIDDAALAKQRGGSAARSRP